MNEKLRFLGYITAFVGICLMAYYGEKGNDQIAAKQAVVAARVAKLVTPPEPLTVTVPTAPPTRYFHTGHYNSTVSSWYYSWSSWEADEVLFASSDDLGTTLCPEALRDFQAANGWSGVTMDQIDVWRNRFGGTQQQVWARVPRYPDAPNLKLCPGMSWDRETQELRVNGKRLAFLVANQPNLNLAMSRRVTP